jgi:serine/threonine-protein kinase
MPDFNLDARNQGTLEVGSFIGGTYRVLDFLGQGGMGFVYKVEHLMMAKVLALKVLRSEQVSEEAWKRFRIEAQAIARLDHANVVRIYDMSQTEAGLPYYTMDLLVGESLADYLDEYYRLPVKEALPIFRQVCAGLAYAHDRGIIHRDIKPGNIMLLRDGRENAPPVVKIVDFGIAKLSSFDSGFGQGLTRPGEVFGSPLYMSPEQCSGQQLDHRTDMYSVGVTMFQALTGRPPLLGKTAIETTAMHQSVVPPAMAEVIDLEEGEEPIVFPPQLEEIVARLLEKSPDARYDSLADVASELLALERGEIRRGQGGPGTGGATGSGGIAPYAVAEAARRKAAYAKTQVLTGEQSETDSGADAASRNQARALVIGLAAVIVVIVLVGVVAVAIYSEPRKTKNATVFTKPVADSEHTAQTIDAIAKLDSANIKVEKRVTPVQAKSIEKYLATQKGFYSRPVFVKGKKIYVFEFPKEFDLGLLSHRTSAPPFYKREHARGSIAMPTNEEMHLSTSPEVTAYPDLLKFFRPAELCEVCFNDSKERPTKLFPILQGFTKLSRLELKSTKLDASDVASIDKLVGLHELCVDNSGLTGAALAQCKILPQLRVLGLSQLRELTPLLKKLSEPNKLEVLEVDQANLGAEEAKYIARLTRLESLRLKANPLKDADIAQFLTLKNLRVLDLSICNNLTPKSIDTLEQLKNLEEVRVPDLLLQPEYEKRLKKALPLLKSFE